MYEPDYFVDGTPPSPGLVCDALNVVECWHQGHRVDPANIVFFRFGENWYRLYFDVGPTIFWRADREQPDSFTAPEIESEYRIVDLTGTLGQGQETLRSVAVLDQGSSVTVALEFSGGSSVEAEYAVEDDTTQVTLRTDSDS